MTTPTASNTTASNTTVRRAAAGALAVAALLAIVGFTALGSVFDYPKILKEPTTDILTSYRAHRTAISGWFLVLVLSAGLLAPSGILLGRIAGGRAGRRIAGVGVAAAAVQVIGLSRWVLLVPGISADETVPAHAAQARHTFELLHLWLGTVIGETVGYALTATFTVLVARTVARDVGGRWMAGLGHGSAALIATGVLVPLGVTVATLTNFAGYVGWSVWLLALAVALWRSAAGSAARGYNWDA